VGRPALLAEVVSALTVRRRRLWARRLGQQHLLHGSDAHRLQQDVVEAAGEETLLLLQERVGGGGDHA
jgi:hypothetical protein